MRKQKLLAIIVLAVAASLLFARPAYAYMDPGGAMPFISFLAPLFAMLLAALAFMFRPIRIFFLSVIRKLLGRPRDEDIETDEQPMADDQGDDGVSEDNADEEAKD